MPVVEEVCTITAKGQTTVPKAIRQALGVGYGGRIAFRVEDGAVSVRAAGGPDEDPALAPFLALMERGLVARPAAPVALTSDLEARMETATRGVAADPDAPIEGEVALSPGVLERHGWRLFGHPLLLDQLDRLIAAAERARRADPAGWRGDANVKLLAALRALTLDRVPRDPLAPEFRQGDTLGPAHRRWFRAKFAANRFRLSFRADSTSRVVVYDWVDDRDTLRKAGAASDPYAAFGRLLAAGNPPDDWADLLEAAGEPAAARRFGAAASES